MGRIDYKTYLIMSEEYHPLYQRFRDTPRGDLSYVEIDKNTHERVLSLLEKHDGCFGSWKIWSSELLVVLFCKKLEEARSALDSWAIPTKIWDFRVTVAPWSHAPI